MLRKIISFLSICLCVCTVCTDVFAASAPSPDVQRLLRQSRKRQKIKDGDNSPALFQNVKYLKGLLEKINWENSSDPQRRELYAKLVDAVNDIDSYEQSEEKQIQAKREELNAAREREQSLANKMLGAAAIGTMGIGGMELASALSEKQVMEDAEQAMRAYLATFTCSYADGKYYKGGEKDIELPGGNELMPLISEYKTLASDLKARKEALGVAPGIESELVLDSATTGLYDDVSLEKTDGAFTSLSRALTDENSEDAAEWAADKEAIDNKIKTSAAVVATAAVASIAANFAINGGNKSAVVSKADATYKEVKQILDEIINNCNIAIAKADQGVDLLTRYEDLETLEGHPICN